MTAVDTRAAAYLRISDDREGTGLGVTRQRDDCLALVERSGYELVGVFEDNDLGAYYRKRRPEWLNLQRLIEQGGVDVIVAWSSDRLTRHPRELEDLVELLEAHNVRVQTVTSGEYDLVTPEGRAYARIVGAIARQESERKSVRAKRKALELAKAGKVGGGGHRPFGFESDRVTVREPEAEEIRRVVARINAGGTMQSVANDLNDRGVRTPTGRAWQSVTLRRLVLSPRIAGLRQHQGEVIGEAAWDRIVDRDEWERARAILTDPNRRSTNGTPRTYLLTGGLVRCGLCDVALVARPAASPNGSRRAYVCASSKTGRFKGCGKLKIDADGLEGFVAGQILGALDSPEFAEVLAQEAGADTAGVSDQIRGEEQALEQLAVDYYSDKLIGRTEFLAARDAIETKIAGLRSSLLPTTVPNVSAGDLRSWWDSAPVADRQEIVKLAADSIVVGSAVRGRNKFDRERVTISYAQESA